MNRLQESHLQQLWQWFTEAGAPQPDLPEKELFLSVSDGIRPAVRLDEASAAFPGKGLRVDVPVSRRSLGTILRPGAKLRIEVGTDALIIGETMTLFPGEIEAFGIAENHMWHPDRVERALTASSSVSEEMLRELFVEEQEDVEVVTCESWFVHDRGVVRLGERPVPSPEVVEAAARRAGDHYFSEAVSRDGRILYEWNPATREKARGYNMLRHAGTVYAMLELYERTGGETLLAQAGKALHFLEQQIQPVGSEGQQALVHNNAVKLGGNGLALVAMAKWTEVKNDRRYVPLMQDLASWILGTQDETGRFAVHKMNAETGEKADFESGYYPGEAMLGLIRLHQLDGREGWLDAAEREASYLIDRRDKGKSIHTIAHDHWLLYALNELEALRPNDKYVAHAELIGEAIFQAQRIEGVQESWVGSSRMKGPPRSTPTACRTEGTGALWQLAARHGKKELMSRCRESMALAVAFQMQMQYTEATVHHFPYQPLLIGALRESLVHYTVRNDFTQHNVSSFLQYLHVLESETAEAEKSGHHE
ncbi:hypothetical protein [Alkalicoccus chagannorensis]|uniref:hypothetical protein n=1 Tax=Alkalicoccus chagannorensis TaxID=427072 RepID=UPI0003FA78CD|nr:hypothetical protein [Alkalicoccus chagannorensis]